ncbi:hypothetical protein CO657_11095 [Rhizobium acidisoli]|uniref:Uncharacterized protein n=1 Tax=Rhizobium acidisoli TaxID=1538158 RepID=A0AAE5TXX6_9HYPH|nr:hypothetical protein [Rhizobium acidisoli]KPH05043.1 hypothetical protein AOG23_30115 [Rhizobium acidisoli]QAS78581.1 hypothetical protein CO657_11095 [Rhizobium acidisoli]
MDEADIKKIENLILRIVPQPDYRKAIRYIARKIIQGIGLLALVTAIVSFVLNGTELFTKTIPRMSAFVAKRVLLAKTFRPFLIRQIVEEELAYADFCILSKDVADLDEDGEETDLLVKIAPVSEKDCTDTDPLNSVDLILKETGWTNIWPSYALLQTIAREGIGTWPIGTDYPVTLSVEGPFLIGSIYGTDFPGYAIYGYSSGVLHYFGRFSPLGAKVENPQAEPSQIGNRLFLLSEQGMQSFEVTANGDFLQKRLTAREILERNNTALVIEDDNALPADAVTAASSSTGGSDPAAYKVANQSASGCDYIVYANGEGLPFTDKKDEVCEATVAITKTTSIISNVACVFSGFRKSSQFPWGWVYDDTITEHSFKCPDDGNEGSKFRYEITAELQ